MPEQQALIHERGWLKMLAPRAVGGAELPLPEVVRLEESIAEADGSMGWVVTLCAGAGWFAGFLPPKTGRAILATPAVCLAGSGAPTGYADREGEGYRISGRWDIASGAPMATHFTLNAILRDSGETRAFVVPAAQVTIEPTWRSIGMRGTASHSYRVDGAWVPASHGFTIDAAHATAPGALYRFPFMLLAYVTLAANLSGMARNFLRLALEMLAARREQRESSQEALANAAAALETTRVRMFTLLDEAWAQAGTSGVQPALDSVLRDASLALAAAARNAVDSVYPYCGLRAAQQDADINRVWRDFHTATQHGLLLP